MLFDMKIVIIGPDPRGIGGAESFSREFVKFFPHVYFIAPYKSLELHKVNNVYSVFRRNFLFRTLNKITNRVLLNILIAFKLWLLKPDIVILNSPIFLPALKFIKLNRLILRQHTTLYKMIDLSDQFSSNINLINSAVSTCEFVALSPTEKDAFLSTKYFKRASIHSIRNHSNISISPYVKENTKTLLMLGRLNNNIKRYDLIINSMNHIPDHKLIICGDGPDKELLINLSINNNQVCILNALSDVYEIFKISSIYVVASEFEGYPISAIEAQTMGLPLIVRDTFLSSFDLVGSPSAGEIIESDFCAASFAKAVNLISNNYLEYSKLAFKNSERFNRESIFNEWAKYLAP